jgi:hypothetical protein
MPSKPGRWIGCAARPLVVNSEVIRQGSDVKTFRRLTIERGPSNEEPDIKAFVEAIMPMLENGWSRDPQREQELKSGHSLELYCFACSRKNKRKAARLFLSSSGGCLWVTNIVPAEANELSYDEYNLIMCEFNERFAKPAAERLGFRTVLTGDEERIEDFLTAPTAELLRAYSKSGYEGGSSLPADRERWIRFLIAAHEEGARLDPYTLRRWLAEEEHWWEDSASELADEYEFARALLAEYDRHE